MLDLYHPPQSSDVPETENKFSLLGSPNRCSASAGWTWTSQTLSVFHAQWRQWLLLGWIAFLIGLPLHLLRVFLPGNIAWIASVCTFLLSTFLLCGTVYAAAYQVANGILPVKSVFIGLYLKCKQVMALGLIQLIIFSVLLLATMSFLVFSFVFMGFDTGTDDLFHSTGIMSTVLPLTGLSLLVGMALTICLSPSLVMLGDVPPLRAIAMNVRGALSNWAPLLVYGLTMVGLAIGTAVLFVMFITIFPKAVINVLYQPMELVLLIFFCMWNALIGYAAYLSVWTNAELEDFAIPLDR